MLNSGEKKSLRATKKINIQFFLNYPKNHNPPPPPFKLNGRSLTRFITGHLLTLIFNV